MTAILGTEETHAGAQHFCNVIRDMEPAMENPRILVAGCGRGHEALFIRRNLRGSLVGIDVAQEWDRTLGADVDDFRLTVGSVLRLPFADDSFDAAFYHHVIEHVDDPVGSLRELARVLRPGGLLYVGTPNRHRAVGYLGSFDASTIDKVRWNLSEYRARLAGRFRNELGCHAGFSENELRRLLTAQFTDVRFLTADYLRFKYGSRLPALALRAITSRWLIGVSAPAVYALARMQPL